MTTDTTMPSRRPRRLPLGVALLGIITLLVSGYFLANRIQEYNRTHLGPVYHFIASDKADFEFAGKQVTIIDEVDQDGEGQLIVTYGEDTMLLPVQIPNPVALPGLDRYRDWFRLTIFAESTKLSFRNFRKGIEDGSILPRLIIVTRNPMSEDVRTGRFSLDVPENWGWGEVMRDRWTFSFYEFLPEGGFDSHTLRFPQSGASFYREQVNADLKGEPAPERRADELTEGSWEFQAALPLMPRPPAITMDKQALRNSGWTLPVASASVLIIMISIAMAYAPDRVTENTP